ncbi:MAG TPA: polysaccharide deacetylase family protein [Negativicutes bacterium]|jgi:peptidoglycan/xylan/chitin deacetylase (PgdA/CDA1 family)
MISRRQFLTGCIGTMAALTGLAFFPEYKIIDKLSKSIPVLLYHRVGSESDALTISTTRFQQDMEIISQEGYHTLSLNQLKQRLQGNLSILPTKPIVITFDDGYLNNYTNAFPILQKFAMTASFYIITGMVGNNDRLNASHIREMETAGMDFGSHTVTHRSLAELTAQEVATELNKSKFDLEQMLGKSVDFAAYPCGSYKAETLNIAGEAGYMGGFSTHDGFASFSNNLAIKRIPIFHYDRSISYVMLRKGLFPSIFN